ncbi:hypothetical protein GCM10010342_47540 [Streptomyces anulatus]|nr:hypothetical protein GCM10010342_47540 [Streptomyces anulatus]
MFADPGYDYDKSRRLLRARGITPKIARKGTAHGSGLGKTPWVAERTLDWPHQFKSARASTTPRLCSASPDAGPTSSSPCSATEPSTNLNPPPPDEEVKPVGQSSGRNR